MGERTAYVVRDRERRSPYLRKQWGIFTTDQIISLVYATARVLSTSYNGEESVGSGLVALREDLDSRRLFAAMVHVLYKPPFDEISIDIPDDIDDHGIFEIEIVKWNHWVVWHYDSDHSEYSKEKVVEVTFEYGKKLSDGAMKIIYKSSRNAWL